VRVFRSQIAGGAARAIGLYAAAGLAVSVVGFFALPVFTRLFTPGEFGVIGLFTAAVGALVPVISLGSYVYILYDRAETHPAGVPSAVLVVATLGAGVAFAAGVVLALVTDLPPALVVAAVATAWANVWIAVRLHAFQAMNRPGRYFALSALPPVVALVMTVLLARGMDGWTPRVVALLLTAVASAVWSTWSLQHAQLIDWREAVSRVRAVVRFGAPIVVHTASIWVVGFTDRFIVAAIEGIGDAGIYTVAYSVGLGVAALHEGVARYFASRLPTWSESPEGHIAATRFSRWYSIAALVSAPLAVIGSVLLLQLLVSSDYSSAAGLLVWLVPAQTLAGIARVHNGYLYVDGRTGQRAVMSLTEAVFNVAATWLLVTMVGTVGAAIGTAATYAVSVVGTVWLARSTSMRKSVTHRVI